MAKKRWTKKEIETVTDLEFLLRICIDRKSDCTNIYAPLYQKLCSVEHNLVEQIKKGVTVKLPPIEEDEPFIYHNYYRCDDCNTEWEDDWSCTCDDECPMCGSFYSPYKSEDIEQE